MFFLCVCVIGVVSDYHSYSHTFFFKLKSQCSFVHVSMEAAPELHSVAAEIQSQPKKGQLRLVIERLKDLLVDPKKTAHFLTACIKQLTIIDNEHESVYELLCADLNSQKRWNKNRWKKPKNLIYSKYNNLISFWMFISKDKRLIRCKIYLAYLLFCIANFFCEWTVYEVTSWKQLPASMYRAMERFIDWSQFPKFKRYDQQLPPEIFSVLSPHHFPIEKNRARERQSSESLSAAAFAIIQSDSDTPSQALTRYSKLTLCMQGKESDDNLINELAEKIRCNDRSVLEISKLLSGMQQALREQMKTGMPNYCLKQVKQVETTPQTGTHEHQLLSRFTKERVTLQFEDTDILTLRAAVNTLKQNYPQLSLGNAVIFEDAQHCYLVLSARDHKLISRGVLPHLHINGRCKAGALPIYPVLLEGLLLGNGALLQQSLQTVYDMIVGYSRRCKYFKTLQDEKLLKKSVQLLAAYARCFDHPNKLMSALTRPYRHSYYAEDSRVVAIPNCYNVQSTVRALIMLGETHHMEWSTLRLIYKKLYKEKLWQSASDETKEEWPKLRRWLTTTYNSYKIYGRTRGWLHMKAKGCESIFITLYNFFLDEECFEPVKSIQLCNKLCVKAQGESIHIPSQLPVLNSIVKYTKEPEAYNNHLNNNIQERDVCIFPDEGVPVEELSELLQQAELVKMFSVDQQEGKRFRGRLVRSVTYPDLDIVPRRIVSPRAPCLPFKCYNGQMLTYEQLFPVHDCVIHGLHLTTTPFHTADEEFLYSIIHLPLPSPCKRRKQ